MPGRMSTFRTIETTNMTAKKNGGANWKSGNSTSLLQPELLSHLNEVTVLHAIQREGELTRSELSGISGVTFPTAAKAVASLLERGLLEETERAPSGRGRPAKCVRISTSRSTVLGIAVGVTKCEIVAAGFDGSFREDTLLRFPPPASYEELLKTVTEHKNSLSEQLGGSFLCAAVSVAGLVDYRESQVRVSAGLPWLDGQSVGSDLSETLGIECAMVRDVHALCLAEFLYDDASDYSTYCVLDGSSGLGVGIMFNGNLFIGGHGYTGEIAHGPKVAGDRPCTCGKKGCLETVASDWGLLSTASEKKERKLSFDELVDLAEQGDAGVLSSIELLTDHLSMALAQVFGFYNPQCIYLQGRMFHHVPGLFDQLLEKTRRQTLSAIFDTGSLQLAAKTTLQGAVASAVVSITAMPVDSLRTTLHGANSISAFAGIR